MCLSPTSPCPQSSDCQSSHLSSSRLADQTIHYCPSVVFLFFLMWAIFFKSFLNFLQYCFCFIFCLSDHEACGILAPWPEIEIASLALEGEVYCQGSLCVSCFILEGQSKRPDALHGQYPLGGLLLSSFFKNMPEWYYRATSSFSAAPLIKNA